MRRGERTEASHIAHACLPDAGGGSGRTAGERCNALLPAEVSMAFNAGDSTVDLSCRSCSRKLLGGIGRLRRAQKSQGRDVGKALRGGHGTLNVLAFATGRFGKLHIKGMRLLAASMRRCGMA